MNYHKLTLRQLPLLPMLRECSKCGVVLPKTEEHFIKKYNPKKEYLRHRCNECHKQYQKSWYQANREKIKQKSKGYYQANREKIKQKSKGYRQVNPEKVKQYQKSWYQANREKIKQRNRQYLKSRYETDMEHKLSRLLRSRLSNAIRREYKVGSAVRDLGCSISELKVHLEAQFAPGMTWDNWALDGWHIDHIKPLASFELTDRRQFLEASHYTNLQPLWASENYKKSDKAE